MYIRCPHCHNPIQMVDDRPDEVVCPGCGSSFRVEGSPLPATEEQLRRRPANGGGSKRKDAKTQRRKGEEDLIWLPCVFAPWRLCVLSVSVGGRLGTDAASMTTVRVLQPGETNPMTTVKAPQSAAAWDPRASTGTPCF